MADRESMIRKVQALWKLADDPGNTVEARESAQFKARDLMAKYQIDEIVVQEQSGQREAIVMKSIRITKDGKVAKFEDQRKALAAIIARENRCRCVIQYLDTSADVDTGKKIAGGFFITVVGYKSDTEFVADLYWMVAMQMLESALEEVVQTANYQANFTAGYVDRINQRLKEIHKRVDTMADEQEGGSMALVLVSRSEAVEKKFEEQFPNLRREKASRKYNYDPNAHERGAAAANRADLGQTKVEGSKKEVGRG